MKKIRPYSAVICSFFLLLSACNTTIPKDALRLAPEALETRQLQTKRYLTADENNMLTASAQVLQDLGFNLEESETKLGVIVASKDRDATESGQVAGAVVMALLLGVYVPTDKNQKIRASLITRPSYNEDKKITSMITRITFQRIVWNTQGKISKLETLDDPKMYEEFFSKLSKAVFLEGEKI